MSFGSEQHAAATQTDTAPFGDRQPTSASRKQDVERHKPLRRPRGARKAEPPEEIFTRIRQGRNVKVRPLAEAIGMSLGGLYQAIGRGDVKAVTVGRAVFVPAHEAGRLLGLSVEPTAQIAA